MPDIETTAPEGVAKTPSLLNGATEPALPAQDAVAQPESATAAERGMETQPGPVPAGPIVTMPRGRRGPPLRAYGIDMIEWVKALVTGSDKTRAEIARETGVSEGTVRRWTRIYDWERPFVVRPRKPAGKAEPSDRRQQLASRLYRNLGRQIGHLEKRLNIGSRESAEKDARTLGILAKTLLTLKDLDRDGAKVGEPERVDRDDLDELDSDLAERITAWVRSGEDN